MAVRPVLSDWEIPRVEVIDSLERRELVELPVPGRVGSLFQDLESSPTRLVVAGSLYGEEARNAFFQELRGRFRSGEPVTFVADVVTATEVEYVVIEELRVEESSVRPDQIDYLVVLRESPPPPPPPDPLGGLDSGLLDQAAGLVDTVTGALDVIDQLAALAGGVPDIVNPTPQLTSAVDSVADATAGLPAVLGPLSAVFGGGSE